MQPPVLELYAVWHPADARKAQPLAQKMIDHYHGDQFTGLIGGAIEVFTRSAGWQGEGSAPRPIPVAGDTGPVPPARHVVVVVFLGLGLAQATRDGGPWLAWLQELQQSSKVMLWGVDLRSRALDSAGLKSLFSAKQLLAAPDRVNSHDETLFLRDLSQSLTQLIRDKGQRIQIFISHAKHWDQAHEQATQTLIHTVRSIVRETRLAEFFDSHSLQAGDDWAARLKKEAAASALLCVRTDHYAGREWCHQEVTAAKTHGMPIVTLDALIDRDRRGSFLLDHMPRLSLAQNAGDWSRSEIQRALLILVDECLKRELWRCQYPSTPQAGVWWSPHAPEPLTFAHWLSQEKPTPGTKLQIIHPDPPLTPCEQSAITAIARLAGHQQGVDILTPHTLAARENRISTLVAPALPANALKGVRLGLSASDSPDLARLGLDNRHFNLALGELARLVLVGGGTLAWGGHLNGLTPLLIEEVTRYGRQDHQSLWICLSWSVHRGTALSELWEVQDRLGAYGKLICLSPDGHEIPLDQDRGEAPCSPLSAVETAHALTKLRQYLTDNTQGRLMIGGKRDNYQGRQPGLVEEALLTLRAQKPLYLAAGFGGTTADIARALGLPMTWLPDVAAPELQESLRDIKTCPHADDLLTGLEKGDLDALASTHRPSDIATLVSRGLGRSFARR